MKVTPFSNLITLDHSSLIGLFFLQMYSPVVHKNTPIMNKQLASVKHLLKITPITFPHGLPSDESDFHHCVLHADGRLTVKKKLTPTEQSLEDPEKDSSKWEMDKETLDNASRKILDGLRLSQEYFPAKYTYKYNQDGKEHRYTGDHNIGADRDWY